MPVEREELRLVWPPELFRREARALLYPRNEETAGWLLDEAFHGGRALQLWREHYVSPNFVRVASMGAGLAAAKRGEDPPNIPLPQDELLEELATAADTIPRYERRRLYSERRAAVQASRLTLTQLKTEVAQVLLDLNGVGYFEDAFGSYCPDSPDDPATEGRRQLRRALGARANGIWPLDAAKINAWGAAPWDDDLLLDLVEVMHEFVSRPRSRHWHQYHQDYDYDSFNRPAGQAVYRWRMNALLERSELGLQLAGHGPDTGLLVEVTGDARDDLVEQVRGRGEPVVVNRVEHAVAQFRRRDATREAKREATRALADVLEKRKSLVKTTLLSKDSNALFQMANEFDIRHMNEQQKAGYNPLFLDWVFWWYLATIDLTNRLIEQQDTP